MGTTEPEKSKIRVRHISRRAPPPAIPSEDTFGRVLQLRFMGWVGAFLVTVGVLLYRGLEEQFGGSIRMFAIAVGAMFLAAITIWFVVAWRRVRLDDSGDVDEDLTPSNVESQLMDGLLSPQDHVYEDARWSTLLESAQFGDVAAVMEAKLNRWRRIGMGALIFVGTVVAGGLFAAVANLGSIFSWLTRGR